MKLLLPLPSACVLPFLFLPLATPSFAASQPLSALSPDLTAQERGRLSQAAGDTQLPLWQRNFMLRLARVGRTSTPVSVATDDHPGRHERASVAADGSWGQLVPGNEPSSGAIYDPVRDRMVVFAGTDSDVWSMPLAGTPVWTRLTPTGTPPSVLGAAIYDPVRDRIVVIGGPVGYFNGVWTLSLAGTPAWTQLTPSGTPPNQLYSHRAIYDPVRDRLLVLRDGAYLNDVWELSLADTPAWTQLTPGGTPPIDRGGHSAIYDPVRDRMVMFGGYGYLEGAYHFLNDVWALSLAGTPEWTELSPSGTPPNARRGHLAIYDPVGDRMVVAGGSEYVGPRNDVWALSLTGTSAWTEMTPTGVPPGPGVGTNAIYDSMRGRMVVVRGNLSSLNDVWALSLAGTPDWTAVASGPSTRLQHSAIYDPVRDRMVVFGGYGYLSSLNEVWALSLAGTPAWTALTPTGTPPSARGGHSAIYDPVRDRMIVFGGYDLTNFLVDVWELSLADAPAWAELTPSGTSPTARHFHSAIYDPLRDRMVVFGGEDDMVSTFFRNDVWALSLAGAPAWTDLAPSGTPPSARGYHGAIYDPVRDRMVTFGGTDNVVGFLNDVWELSLAGTPTWTDLTPSGTPPKARIEHRTIYDPVRDRVVVFGGNDYVSPYYLGDVWELSLAGLPTWSELVPTGTPPSGRVDASAVYDPVRDRMVVFGGAIPGASLNDVWALIWGAPVLASVTCPGDSVWTVGANSLLNYSATNPYGFAETVDYTLTSGRDWPGFPIVGSVVLGPNSTVSVPISVPVPDSAAIGLNPLTFHMTLRSMQQHVVCSHNLHDVTTPVLLSLVSVQAEPGRVRLTWWDAGGGGGVVATVYRRTVMDEWISLGQVSADGTGQIVYEDTQAAAGTRYGYRLGVQQGGEELMLGETWVDVPRTAQFALAGLRPNPAVDAVMVAFSLPDGSPARIEMFDLAGRRVVARDVGSLGGGSHIVRLWEGRALASGVYLLRLTRGERAATTRAVIVR